MGLGTRRPPAANRLSGESSPSADVAGVSPVLVQMWHTAAGALSICFKGLQADR